MIFAETTVKSILKTLERSEQIEKQRAALLALKEELEDENPHIEILRRLGFTVLFYGQSGEECKIGFVNYHIDKKNDFYYKIIFDSKSGKLEKGRDDVTDEDVQKIQKILEMEVLKND